MTELRALCSGLGFAKVATYIQSGNVVFQTRSAEARVKAQLERALERHLGKPVGVMVRTREQLQAIVDKNPFTEVAPNRLLILFLDATPPEDGLKDVSAPGGEELRLLGRELFIHFPDGMGKSKLKVPFQKTGTGRNLNTTRKLLQMLDGLER